MYMVDESECTGCGICPDCCRAGAIAMRGQVAEIEQLKCDSCGACRGMCPQNAIYEVVPATTARSPAVAASTPIAVRAPDTVSLRANRMTREQKAAALAAVLPAVTKVLLRLADLFLSRYDRDVQAGGIVKSGYDISSHRSGRGRHRWRGGS
jgi:NAD-dependent dihydropyrimidine dehydrogenase PreA subunit